MKRKNMILGSVLSMIILTGCSGNKEFPSQVTETDRGSAVLESSSDGTIERLEEKIKVRNGQIEVLEGINEEYFEFIESTLKYLDEEELKDFAQSLYRYTLTINGVKYEAGDEVELSEGPVEVKVVSEMLFQINLPQKLYELGSLPGFVDDHISFNNQEPENLEVTDGTVVQAYIYTFGEEKPIEDLEIHLSEELREHLGLDTDVIDIEFIK